MLLLLVKYRLAKKINPLFLLLNGNYSWDVALQHGQCAATYKHFISPQLLLRKFTSIVNKLELTFYMQKVQGWNSV